MIPNFQIEKILQDTNIVDIISEYVDLRRAGVNFKGCCPFHDEKTPSFVVSESKQIYKCFGCGAGGNVFKFLMDYEKVSYPQAIKLLASKIGLVIEEEKEEYNSKQRIYSDKKEIYFEIMKEACDFFYNNLLNVIEDGENQALLNYIRKRGLTNGIIKLFKIGYAPLDWQNLNKSQKLNSYKKEDLITTGLLKSKNNRTYSTFRNRLIFPILNQFGDPIAFSARDLENNANTPKYINSPEYLLYNKSSTFLGFYQAKEMIRKSKQAIITEGNMDQISLFKYGFKNSLALCGTALTKDHVKIIKRNCEEVILLFDGDKAGKKASEKSANLLNNSEIENRIVFLPPQEDPDSFILKYGSESLKEKINEAKNIIDYQMEIENNSSIIKHLNKLLVSLSFFKDPLKIDYYLNSISNKFQISKEALSLKMSSIKPKQEYRKNNLNNHLVENKKEIYSQFVTKDDELEMHLLYVLMIDKKYIEKYLSLFSSSPLINPFFKNIEQQILQSYHQKQDFNITQYFLKVEHSDWITIVEEFIIQQDQLFFRTQTIDYNKLNQAFTDAYKKLKNRFFSFEIHKLQNLLQEEILSDTDFDISKHQQSLLKFTSEKFQAMNTTAKDIFPDMEI